MVGTIVHQLTKGVSPQEMEKAGLGAYYTDHGNGVYPQAAAGWPFNAAVLAVKGDPIADLQEDLAADKEGFKCNYDKNINEKCEKYSIFGNFWGNTRERLYLWKKIVLIIKW